MPATLSIKNVPDEVLVKLRERAARNHRSLQGELQTILEEALEREGDVVRRRNLTPREILARVNQLGLRTNDDSVRIIRELRDSR